MNDREKIDFSALSSFFSALFPAIIALSICASFFYNLMYFSTLEFNVDVNYSHAFMPMLTAVDYVSSSFLFFPIILSIFAIGYMGVRLVGWYLQMYISKVIGDISAVYRNIYEIYWKIEKNAARGGVVGCRARFVIILMVAINFVGSIFGFISQKLTWVASKIHYYRTALLLSIFGSSVVFAVTRNMHVRWFACIFAIACVYLFLFSKRKSIIQKNNIVMYAYVGAITVVFFSACSSVAGIYMANISAIGKYSVNSFVRDDRGPKKVSGTRSFQNGIFFVDRDKGTARFVSWQGDVAIERGITIPDKRPVACKYAQVIEMVERFGYIPNCSS